MNKEFEYEQKSFSKLTDLLRNNYTQSEKDKFESNHAVYHAELILAYRIKSEMPVSFRFKMKLELLKVNNSTKLNVYVETFKFYGFILVLLLFLYYITFQVNSLILLNLLWILPILILIISFRSRLSKEVDLVEQKLIRQIQK